MLAVETRRESSAVNNDGSLDYMQPIPKVVVADQLSLFDTDKFKDPYQQFILDRFRSNTQVIPDTYNPKLDCQLAFDLTAVETRPLVYIY